jgi:hypothetical protein
MALRTIAIEARVTGEMGAHGYRHCPDRAIYQALKAADEAAAALQAHLVEDHGASPDLAAEQDPSASSLRLLRQARERLGEGLRAVEAPAIAESDDISLRNN